MVANKAERTKPVVASIDEVLAGESLPARAVPSLFGRIQFMEGQLMGLGRLVLSDLRALARKTSELRL